MVMRLGVVDCGFLYVYSSTVASDTPAQVLFFTQ
jgi:hypothetical protein